MVNLEHLQVLEAICSEGSFQKASEKLHKVRSAVSYSVKQVESYYEIQIFDRETYRPTLTNDGKILMTQVRKLLHQASEFETFVKEMKGENETELHLGVSSVFPLQKITDLLTTLKEHFPQTTLHLELEVASGERRLLEEKVDIAIYPMLSRDKAVDYKRIDTLNIPLVIASDSPLAKKEAISELDLATFPQVVVKSTDGQAPDNGIIDDALKWYVTDAHSKKILIKAGLGWGRLPYHFVEQELNNKELISLDTLGKVELPIYICKLKNKTQGL